MKRFLITIVLSVAASSMVAGSEPQSAPTLSTAAQTTPAYAVLASRKAAVESELALLSASLTSEHPSVQSKRYELHAITVELNKMLDVDPSRPPRLSSSVGHLVLAKVALEVELNELLGNLNSQHPDVEKKRVQLAAVEGALEHLLR
jgi:uncharacterized protein involved in exopolysaccharide biosynthesis